MKEVRLDEESTRCKIGFIGAGTVGTALAIRLGGKGYPVVAVSSRTITSAKRLVEIVPGCRAYDSAQAVADSAQLVFITTPDDAIEKVAGEIRWKTGQGVVHCSGADSTDILESASKRGALVGGFHPLQTFASTAHAIENIPGSTFAVEAEEPLIATLRGVTTALEGTFIRLSAGDKVLYHAAAVVACNYLVTLVKLATDLWQSFGVSSQQATLSLLPLLRGTLNNIDNIGIPDCLTGPIARGDSGTIKKHISALERSAPGILSTYRELGLQTIPIALAKGTIDNEKGNELQTLLKEVNS